MNGRDIELVTIVRLVRGFEGIQGSEANWISVLGGMDDLKVLICYDYDLRMIDLGMVIDIC